MYILRHQYIPLIVLCCAVLLGAIGRGTALYTWDGEHTLHPDERFLVYTVLRLQVPDTWQAYGDNQCAVDGIVPAPSATRDLRGVDLGPAQWEPSRSSGCNSLNPRNFGWSQRFVYGAFPTTMVRIGADWVFGRDATPLEIRNTGRTLAWLSEVVAIVLVYWLARAVVPARASAWAAMLYALAPLPMQLSHFFTVDAILSPWVIGALGLALRLERQRWRDWVWFAMCVAIASAMRITMLSLAILALISWMRQWRQWSWRMSGMVLGASLVGVVTLWITDPTWWQDGWFEPRWLADIMVAGQIVSGGVDTPPTFQWVDAVPWLYPWWQMSWWGLGLGVSLGGLYGIWLTLGRRWRSIWLLVIWVVLFFVWQGGVFGMTMRYYMPMYAALCVLAVGALAGISVLWRQRVLVLMLVASLVPAVAWQQMYRQPHPRIETSEWMYAHIPDGSTIAVEQWDDALPLVAGDNTPGRYRFVALQVFDADRPSKFVTIDNVPGLIAQLAQADYIVLSSARGQAVIPKMPLRFPVMTQYYTMLLDGRLGYELVYRAERWPHIGSWWRDTRIAEEALSVYDHPQVLIFVNRDRLDAETLATRLLDDVRWSDVAHTTTAQYRTRPDLGLIDARTWRDATQSEWPWRGTGGWPMWLLLVDGLMMMVVPWLRRWRDHGVTIGRALGCIVLIGMSGLPLPLSTILMGLGAMLPIAVWGWWRHGRQIVQQVRQHWRLVLGGEVIWLVMVGLAAWSAGGASDPSEWWRQVAIINQQMRGTWPVVADPWLAGFVMLDSGSVWRAAAVLGMASGSDGYLSLMMMIATASGVMAQLLWYVAYIVNLSRRQLWWRGGVIVAVLLAGNLVPLVRAVVGSDDPLWSASHTADGSGWVPVTWFVSLLRADTPALWQAVWWGLAAMMLWRRAWLPLGGLLLVVVSFGAEMAWWVASIGAISALWYWWGHRRMWVAVIVVAVLLRLVAWQVPHGSATMLLVHAWPVLGALGVVVWHQPHRRRRDVVAVGLWIVWGVLSAWFQLPVWLLLIGWGCCAGMLGRRYGTQIWVGIGLVLVISMLPLAHMTIGYQLLTFAIWGYLGWHMLAHMRHTWWLAPAFVWVVWMGGIVRPTLSYEEAALVAQLVHHPVPPVVVVDTDVNRAQRLAAASGSVLWVAPPSQLDTRWLALGWRDLIRQRWQYTLDMTPQSACVMDARVDRIIMPDGRIISCE